VKQGSRKRQLHESTPRTPSKVVRDVLLEKVPRDEGFEAEERRVRQVSKLGHRVREHSERLELNDQGA
jgi:hypothetical protein